MMSDLDDRPVFIAGPDRSGTTLLYALLASHPAISMVRRMNYWRWFYGRYGDLKDQQNFERILDRLMNYKRMQRLHPDAERIRSEFWHGEPSYARLLALFLRQHAEQDGKTRWGDKSLHTEHYAGLVLEQFPQAKIIHMSRDPRDRYASVRKRFGKDNPRLAGATARWLESMNVAAKNRQKYPESYLIVRYEDLASRPEETARRICEFIGEKYAPEMLSMEGAAEYRNSGGNSSFNKIQPGAISTSPIGRYREVLSPFEILFIQRFAGRVMRDLGYETVEVKLSPTQALRFYGWFLPLTLARMSVWSVINAVVFKRKAVVPANRFIDGRVDNDYEFGGSHV